MARRRTVGMEDGLETEDRPRYRPRLLDDTIFLRGDYTGDSLDDVWDEDPDYVLRLLDDDDLDPVDRAEISVLVGEDE